MHRAWSLQHGCELWQGVWKRNYLAIIISASCHGINVFRTAINLSHTRYTYDGNTREDGAPLTAADIEQGAIKICEALRGKYP